MKLIPQLVVETFILLFFLLTEVKDGLLIVVVQIYDEERFKLLEY